MKNTIKQKLNRHSMVVLIVGILALVFTSAPAVASPFGPLNIANCSGGSVTVSATAITWAVGGCMQTGGGTSVVYNDTATTTATLGAGINGVILNLPGGAANFMTFSGISGLHFDLAGLGPGVANTTCAGLAIGSSCSPFSGSSFILTNTGGGTSVTLSAFGNASDGFGSPVSWNGAFTKQIPNVTAASIQSTIAGGGSITNTYSGSFTATITPEPSSLTLMIIGLGLAGLGLVRSRIARRA